jgi:hypothetical protein
MAFGCGSEDGVEALEKSMVEDAVTAIREKLDLSEPELPPEYRYPSLPLCVIDAVFSIGVRYEGVRRTVAAWRAVHQPHTISDALLATGGRTGEELARAYFGGNRQRTSTRNGILKADAVIRFMKALQRAGIEDFEEARDERRLVAAWEGVRKIPGQRSGISFGYFQMLAGDETGIKPDRMICRFVATALGEPEVAPDRARRVIEEACALLRQDFAHLTPRLLDYAIWEYQRAIARQNADRTEAGP